MAQSFLKSYIYLDWILDEEDHWFRSETNTVRPR